MVLASSASQRRAGAPLLIGERALPLERERLGGGAGGEAWLQALIHAHPELLPIPAIEPGFGRPVAVARELPCGHGFIDNLLVTPEGQLVLVEAKLWSNPQARREVVAQALDYVAALMTMGLEELEAAIRLVRHDVPTLHDLVRDEPEALDEARFNDAVAGNLARGRMLVLIVGDGIAEGAERLAAVVQGSIAAQFTLALVELGVWRTGRAERLVVPATLARTVMIERGVVRLGSAGLVAEAAPSDPVLAPQARTISDAEFDALMEARRPGLARDIRAFAESLAPLGVEVDQQRSLNLKLDQGGEAEPVNLGYIQRNGQLRTNAVEWTAPMHLALTYLADLARAIGGSVIETQHHFVTLDGRSAPRIEQLLPAHGEAWRQAVARLARALEQERRERR